MSIRQLHVAYQIRGIGSSNLTLLRYLAWLADEDGKKIYPKVSTIVEVTELNRSTVYRSFKFLQAKPHQYLKIASSGRGRKFSEYELLLPENLLKEYDKQQAKKVVRLQQPVRWPVPAEWVGQFGEAAILDASIKQASHIPTTHRLHDGGSSPF